MGATLALFGAAGKMGTRISAKLINDPDLHVLYIEGNPAAEDLLRKRGLLPTPGEEAARKADIVILAVPDTVLGKVAHSVVPLMKSRSMLICLDAAAPYAGELPQRDDITYFVTHPCHPPIFSDDLVPLSKRDFWGGTARQHIVCALMQGPEADYARGEAIARKIYAPVMKAHRVTVEQLAVLEPGLAETLGTTLVVALREALEETIRLGVPPEAARDFLLGHLGIVIAIFFGYFDAQISDGAKLIVKKAMKEILRPDWKKLLHPENVKEQVKAITEGTLR